MLVRMYPDVIDLKPAAVTWLAGTNDIAAKQRPQHADHDPREHHGDQQLSKCPTESVILCAVTPIADYGRIKTRKAAAARRHPEDQRLDEGLRRKNGDLLRLFQRARRRKELKPGISMDGLHPNDAGYKIMAPVVQAAIDQALGK